VGARSLWLEESKNTVKDEGQQEKRGGGAKSASVVSVVEDLIIRPMRRQTL